MAYFSNGTEGSMYEDQYCNNCKHMYDEKGESYACAVLELHYEHNYGQFGKTKAAKAIKSVLDTLIPRDEKGFNDECSMFTPKAAIEPAEAKYLEAVRWNEPNKLELFAKVK